MTTEATPVALGSNDQVGNNAERATLTARWYCVTCDGLSTLCLDEANARAMAAQCDQDYPRHAPHRAVLMGDVAAAEREIERLHGVVRKVNARCDHLGMSLRDIIAEREALRKDAERWRAALSAYERGVVMSHDGRSGEKDGYVTLFLQALRERKADVA